MNKTIILSTNNVIKIYKIMACGCKNKQNGVTKQAPQRPSNPLNNGNVGSRRIEKRIIR